MGREWTILFQNSTQPLWPVRRLTIFKTAGSVSLCGNVVLGYDLRRLDVHTSHTCERSLHTYLLQDSKLYFCSKI